MQGVLITNHYVRSEKFKQLFAMLLQAAEDAGIAMQRRTNFETLTDGLPANTDFVLFWDKDVRLARELERQGYRLFNSAAAIEACDDKSRTHTLLCTAGIPCPETVFSPLLHYALDWDREPMLDRVEQRLAYPMVVKECYGSFGQKVHLAQNRAELEQICNTMDTRPFLFQQFIAESTGRDIRINVVGGKIVAAMVRENNDGDFRANVAMGGAGRAYTPTAAEAEMALAAAKVLGLDFGGMDILFGANGPIFCEANSNMHFKGIYSCTGVNTAEHIMAHIKREMAK